MHKGRDAARERQERMVGDGRRRRVVAALWWPARRRGIPRRLRVPVSRRDKAPAPPLLHEARVEGRAHHMRRVFRPMSPGVGFIAAPTTSQARAMCV
jgi:hypothetical protein